MGRILVRILAAVLAVALVALGGSYLWLRTSLPMTVGQLTLPGLHGTVRVTRDRYGIPTIVAQEDRGAAFALGFVHAQDRLFQMDMMRRFAAGRLSEWFGRATLDSDRFVRTLGLYRAVEHQYPQLPEGLRATLESYAAGVNAYLSAHNGALPPEYYLLRAQPEPWRPADSLAWGKVISLQLTGNFRGELLRARLLRTLTPEQLEILYQPYPGHVPLLSHGSHAWLQQLPLEAISARLPPEVGPHSASNGWVVDGTHSASGKPILANDPHLGFSAPGVWYLARIQTPELRLSGATAPGTPFVVLGHNEHIAWGFTNTKSDVQDLFIEKPDPNDPRQYLTPEGPRPFMTRSEDIRVKDGPPVALTVRATRHGPVISDLGAPFEKIAPDDHVLALQTTWLADDDRTPEAIWRMARAKDWSIFQQALEQFVGPQQNVVYADIHGNVGFIAPGRVPIRRRGEGWVPVPGWTDEYDWIGFVPYDALPRAFNPPSGHIVTANHKIVADSYPYFLSRDWDAPYRAERIARLLAEVSQQSIDTTAAIQGDVLSLMAKQLLPLMLRASAKSSEASAAMQRLRGWDAQMKRGRAEPLLFVAWLREFNRSLFAERLGAEFSDYWALNPLVIHAIVTKHPGWCDDAKTPAVESCEERLADSLDRAIRQLARRFGPEMASWTWGEAHQAAFPHPIWSRISVLRDWFGVRIASDGGNDTVNNGMTSIRNALAPYAHIHGPTFRMIIDMARPDRARFVLTPGQSGNVLSPHHADLMPLWRDVLSVEFSDDASGGVLHMNPR